MQTVAHIQVGKSWKSPAIYIYSIVIIKQRKPIKTRMTPLWNICIEINIKIYSTVIFHYCHILYLYLDDVSMEKRFLTMIS